MHWLQKYPPLIPQAKEWPIVQLHKKRKVFIQAVIQQSIQALLTEHTREEELQKILQKTLAREKIRLKAMPWKVDPSDEGDFWEGIALALAGAQPAVNSLEKIITRYAHEISGYFSVTGFQCFARGVVYALAKLLKVRGISLLRISKELNKKVQIIGKITQIRQLAKKSTIVIVPTHCSHLDSILVGWVFYMLGLPPLIYGAGLNLLNSRVFACLTKNVGTYKVDRRKKNLPYFTTLKTYARLALQWGCHNLFYPGGTRSRSGSLETKLKLGLLHTALEAQRKNYQDQGKEAAKLFIVPVVVNYSCVLEAPSLIKSYLSSYQPQPVDTQVSYTRLYKVFRRCQNFLTKSMYVTVSIGQALDPWGNVVDQAGNSYGPTGEPIAIDPHFCHANRTKATSCKDDEESMQRLTKAIIHTYYKINCVLSSSLIAFTAFVLLKKQHATLPLATFFQLPQEALVIPYATLERTFAQLHSTIMQLQQANQLQVAAHLQAGSIASMIHHGLAHLGVYHVKKPLIKDKAGNITTQDLPTLFYYHNRLTGYGLEKTIE